MISYFKKSINFLCYKLYSRSRHARTISSGKIDILNPNIFNNDLCIPTYDDDDNINQYEIKKFEYLHRIHRKLAAPIFRQKYIPSRNDELIEILCKNFNLTKDEATTVTQRKVFEINEEILKIIDLLCLQNITSIHILNCSWLLYLTYDELQERIDLLLQLNMFNSTIDGLGFTLFSPELIKLYEKKFNNEAHLFPNYKNRIYYVCDTLKMPVHLYTSSAVLKWNVLHQKIKKMDKVIASLQEFKFEPELIAKNATIFTRDPSKIQDRLKRFAVETPAAIGPWISYCSEIPFQIMMKTHNKRLKALRNYENTSHMIASELNCPINSIHDQFLKLRNRLSSTKALKNIRILQKSGLFDNHVIGNNIRILVVSDKILNERIKIFKLRGVQKNAFSCSLFTYTAERFDKYLLLPKKKL